MPVPYVEGFDPQLDVHPAAEAGVLDQGDVLVVEAEAPEVRHAGPGPVVEVERVDGLERVLVEQRALVRVVARQVLGERIRPGLEGGDAAGPELPGHVAEAGPEEERDARRVAEERARLPSAQDGVGHAPLVEVLPSLAEGQLVDHGRRQHMGDIIGGQRVVPVLLVG